MAGGGEGQLTPSANEAMEAVGELAPEALELKY